MPDAKPVVVVLLNGRPLSIGALQGKVPAILEAWFPDPASAVQAFGAISLPERLPQAVAACIDPARSVQVGIRTWNDDFMGIQRLDAPTVHEIGVDETIRRILAIVGDNPTYLTFDIDCLDPAFAPGTGTPVPGGLTSAQALKIIRNMGDVNLVGMDVVEVSPPFDQSEITAIAAAHIACDLLCVLRNRKLAGKL